MGCRHPSFLQFTTVIEQRRSEDDVEFVEQMLVKGFIASNLYVTIKPAIVEAGEGS